LRADDGESTAGPRRLRDHEGASPTERRALDALRAVAPLTPTAEERRRRLAAIEARDRAGLRRPIVFRPAVALTLLLAGSGAVAATAGRASLVRAYERVAATFTAQTPRAPRAPAPRSEAAPEVEPSEAPAAEPAPPVPARAPAPRPARAATTKQAPAARAEAPPTPPPADEPLVYEAMVALRQRGDRATAAARAFTYLERHPQGPLAEEALEIAREALSQSSPARARELAREYLRRFPRGVYRAAAERTIAGEGR
jgi:outer membrane biosynthesis protein TonB